MLASTIFQLNIYASSTTKKNQATIWQRFTLFFVGARGGGRVVHLYTQRSLQLLPLTAKYKNLILMKMERPLLSSPSENVFVATGRKKCH